MRSSRTSSGFVWSVLVAVALCSSGLGCAFGEIRWDDPMGRLYALEEIQNNYTQLVRWNDYYTAMRFVDPELHEEFMKRNDMTMRFTDHQSGRLALDEGQAASTVEVRYLGYEPDRLIEVMIREKQVWYRDGPANDWFVRPHFIGIEAEPPPRVRPDESAELADAGSQEAKATP